MDSMVEDFDIDLNNENESDYDKVGAPKAEVCETETDASASANPRVRSSMARLDHWQQASPRNEVISLIASERIRQHLTQRELAERTGLKQSNISRLETGKSNPSIDFLARIAAGLGKELQVRLK